VTKDKLNGLAVLTRNCYIMNRELELIHFINHCAKSQENISLMQIE